MVSGLRAMACTSRCSEKEVAARMRIESPMGSRARKGAVAMKEACDHSSRVHGSDGSGRAGVVFTERRRGRATETGLVQPWG